MPDDTRLQARSTPGTRALLSRILSEPDLPAQIERLPPQVLGSLIDRVGLEDAGEIVALATTAQLAQVFDEDLWKNERPGEDERFDAARFLLWLEVLLEAGEAFVAKRLAELPEDLVTLAFHRHLLVIDIDALAVEVSDAGEADDQLEKALESTLHEELGEYRLIARRHDGFDTLLTAIVALDRDHHAQLSRILERCCAMSARYIEENDGLYEVLTSEEMLEADVAGDREDRRAERGHVAPAAAKSFLALARVEPLTDTAARDPVTKAYFRDLDRTPAPPPRAPAKPAASHALPRILADAGIAEGSAPPLLAAGPSATEEPLFLRAMRALHDPDPRLFDERAEELAYLANVLVAGASFRDRRLRPIEALRAAIATASLGLSASTSPKGALSTEPSLDAAVQLLRETSADRLFRRGYRLLHDAVVLPAARAAIATLDTASALAQTAPLDTASAPAQTAPLDTAPRVPKTATFNKPPATGAPAPRATVRSPLAKAAAALRAALADEKPWLARAHLDALTSILPPPSLGALRALLDELPSFDGALADSPSPRPGDSPLRLLASPADVALATRFLRSLTAQISAEEPPSPSPKDHPVPPKKPASRNKPPAKQKLTPKKPARTRKAPSPKKPARPKKAPSPKKPARPKKAPTPKKPARPKKAPTPKKPARPKKAPTPKKRG